MTDAHIKEQFSTHVVKMMASLAGCVIGTTNLDRGADFQIREVEKILYPGNRNRFFLSGTAIDIQLKTTSTFQFTEDGAFVKFDLEVKNLNDLEQRRKTREEYSEGIIPLLLLVHCIPADKNDLVVVSRNEVKMKGDIFWYYPDQPVGYSTKKSKERIFIPTENHVNLKFFERVFGSLYKKAKK